MTSMETEVKDIKKRVIEISEKLDELLYERQIVSIMKLTEASLSEFLENEPNIYGVQDIKIRYE